MRVSERLFGRAAFEVDFGQNSVIPPHMLTSSMKTLALSRTIPILIFISEWSGRWVGYSVVPMDPSTCGGDLMMLIVT